MSTSRSPSPNPFIIASPDASPSGSGTNTPSSNHNGEGSALPLPRTPSPRLRRPSRLSHSQRSPPLILTPRPDIPIIIPTSLPPHVLAQLCPDSPPYIPSPTIDPKNITCDLRAPGSPPPRTAGYIEREAYHPVIDCQLHKEMKFIFDCLDLAGKATDQFLERWSTKRLPHGFREFLYDVVLKLPRTEADWPWARRDLANASAEWLRGNPVTIVEAIGNQVPEGPLITVNPTRPNQRVTQIFDNPNMPPTIPVRAQGPEEVPMRLFLRKPRNSSDIAAGVSVIEDESETSTGWTSGDDLFGMVRRVRTTPVPTPKRRKNGEDEEELLAVAGPSRYHDMLRLDQRIPSLLFSETDGLPFTNESNDQAAEDARLRGLRNQLEVEDMRRQEEIEARRKELEEQIFGTSPVRQEEEDIPENTTLYDDEEVYQLLYPDFDPELSPQGSPAQELEPEDEEEDNLQAISLFTPPTDPTDLAAHVEEDDLASQPDEHSPNLHPADFSEEVEPEADSPRPMRQSKDDSQTSPADVPSINPHPTDSQDEAKQASDAANSPPPLRRSTRAAALAAKSTTTVNTSSPIASTSHGRPTRGRKSLTIKQEEVEVVIPSTSTSTATSGPSTRATRRKSGGKATLKKTPAKMTRGKAKADLNEWNASRLRKRKRDEEEEEEEDSDEDEPKVAEKDRRPMKKLRSGRRS